MTGIVRTIATVIGVILLIILLLWAVSALRTRLGNGTRVNLPGAVTPTPTPIFSFGATTTLTPTPTSLFGSGITATPTPRVSTGSGTLKGGGTLPKTGVNLIFPLAGSASLALAGWYLVYKSKA